MEAAFHGVDFRVPQLASQQCAFVSCHRGYREVGDILVGQFFRVRKSAVSLPRPEPSTTAIFGRFFVCVLIYSALSSAFS